MKKCCLTGHRPDKLPDGYNMKGEGTKALAKQLTQVVMYLIGGGHSQFISGGAIGSDILFAKIILALKKRGHDIQLFMAVPFESQPNMWSQENKEEYFEILNEADKVIYVDELKGSRYEVSPYGIYNPYKMQVRNEFMVDMADTVIAVYDGYTKGGTRNCIDYATKKGKTIIPINPNKFRR